MKQKTQTFLDNKFKVLENAALMKTNVTNRTDITILFLKAISDQDTYLTEKNLFLSYDLIETLNELRNMLTANTPTLAINGISYNRSDATNLMRKIIDEKINNLTTSPHDSAENSLLDRTRFCEIKEKPPITPSIEISPVQSAYRYQVTKQRQSQTLTKVDSSCCITM